MAAPHPVQQTQSKALTHLHMTFAPGSCFWNLWKLWNHIHLEFTLTAWMVVTRISWSNLPHPAPKESNPEWLAQAFCPPFLPQGIQGWSRTTKMACNRSSSTLSNRGGVRQNGWKAQRWFLSQEHEQNYPSPEVALLWRSGKPKWTEGVTLCGKQIQLHFLSPCMNLLHQCGIKHPFVLRTGIMDSPQKQVLRRQSPQVFSHFHRAVLDSDSVIHSPV